MRNPTVRLLLIIGLTLGIGLGMAWIYLRQKGFSEAISPVRSAFFDKFSPEPFALIAHRGSAKNPNSVTALQIAADLHPKIILWVDIVMTADEQLIVSSEKTIFRDGRPTLVSLLKYSDLGTSFPLLKDILAQFALHRFILNVRDYRPGMDGKLATLIDSIGAGERILVQSEQDGILRDLRTLRPQWIFGTSQAQITQLLMLVPFGLEVIAPVKGDVYITDASRGESKLVNSSVVNEMHRRGRKVFVGPVADENLITQLRELGVDGIITGDPESYVRFL